MRPWTMFVTVRLSLTVRSLLLILPLLVTGCGQTGPLFLPEPVATEAENTGEVATVPGDPNLP